MTGKEKCRLLKQIRREIAEANGIVYLSADCTFEGKCLGTCPKCDAEVRYLDSELNRMVEEGKPITLAGLSLDTFEACVGEPVSSDFEEREGDRFDDFGFGAIPIEFERGHLEPGPISDVDLEVIDLPGHKKERLVTTGFLVEDDE